MSVIDPATFINGTRSGLMAKQVAEGLQHFTRANNIFHCDIKPAKPDLERR